MRRLREKERAITLGLFFLDRIFKYFAIRYDFGLVNFGISFGLLSLAPAVYFIIIGLLFVIFLLKLKNSLFVTLLLAGGISNLCDRIVYGGVVDYISIGPLPVFNLADVMVVGGALGFVVDFALSQKL